MRKIQWIIFISIVFISSCLPLTVRLNLFDNNIIDSRAVQHLIGENEIIGEKKNVRVVLLPRGWFE